MTKKIQKLINTELAKNDKPKTPAQAKHAEIIKLKNKVKLENSKRALSALLENWFIY